MSYFSCCLTSVGDSRQEREMNGVHWHGMKFENFWQRDLRQREAGIFVDKQTHWEWHGNNAKSPKLFN